MKELLFIIVMLTFSNSIFADVFDDLDREVALIDKFCLNEQGRVTEEITDVRNNKTGEIISSTIEQIVYCFDGSRHVVGKSEDTKKTLNKSNRKTSGVEY